MIFALRFSLPSEVPLTNQKTNTREDAVARFNDFCSELVDDLNEPVFYGISEGVLLSEEAHERGYETESWVLDAGMAPHERDWLKSEKILDMIAYFKTRKGADEASLWLKREFNLAAPTIVEEQEDQDWNATWKASFMGIEVDETLRVLPPWHQDWLDLERSGKSQDFSKTGILVINPGAGFGTGTHETTQLCLKILRSLGDLQGKTILDFGSGSGILGIAAALQGGTVYCVEIDPLANDNALENAKINGVETRIHFSETIPSEIQGGKVDVLIANILRPILLQFAPEIKDCLKPKSELVLSGLIETDLPQVISTYQLGQNFEVHRSEKNEWRALWLRRL